MPRTARDRLPCCSEGSQLLEKRWVRGMDLNHEPLGYEPAESR
jgi:hypothetical protein